MKESDEQIPTGAILARKTPGQGLARHAASALLSSFPGERDEQLPESCGRRHDTPRQGLAQGAY